MKNFIDEDIIADTVRYLFKKELLLLRIKNDSRQVRSTRLRAELKLGLCYISAIRNQEKRTKMELNCNFRRPIYDNGRIPYKTVLS